MLDIDNLTENNNTDIYDELSLESILAEYSDFDAEKAAERETLSRSRQIVYEALGETEFSGGLDSVQADDTTDAYYDEPEPESEPQPDGHVRDYYRTASSYSQRPVSYTHLDVYKRQRRFMPRHTMAISSALVW